MLILSSCLNATELSIQRTWNENEYETTGSNLHTQNELQHMEWELK
jgi:hypothetical protein